MDIYIARGEERKGPYSGDSIRQFLADGLLDGTELAWHEGLAEWIALSQIDGIVIQEVSRAQPPLHVPTQVVLNSPEAKSAIEAAIRMAAEKPTGELTEADLEKVEKLNLSNNKISDVSALAGLTQLTDLHLGFNKISDVSGLKELKQLTNLELYSNQISDVSALKELTHLTGLNLSENKIDDVGPSKELKQLKSLDLGFNQISDVSALKELKRLTNLNLRDNQIGDVSALKALNQLIRLHLEDNPNLTKDQIAELQKALPRCRIEHNATK